MSEDKEYLPSIQKAKLERRNKMPDQKDKINQIQEGMSFSGKTEPEDQEDKNVHHVELADSDAIEKRINDLDDKRKDYSEPSSDQEEPMTTDRKIHLLSKIFPFAIGDRIKNLFDEDGIIDLVGLDDRGVVYLVQYKENRVSWESEHKIRKNESYSGSQDDSAKRPGIKTDIE